MPKPEHPRPESFLAAAQDRAADAQSLFDAGRHASAIWIAGIAIEAMLRGYHRRSTDQLDTGHNLKQLFRASGFGERVPAPRAPDVAAAMSLLFASWRHRFRYDPAETMLRIADIPPRLAERHARRVMNAMWTIVNEGVSRWPS